MSNKSSAGSILPVEALSLDEAPRRNRESLTRMPVLVVAFALIWFGII